MKTCSKCKREKPRSEFFVHKRKKDGLSYWCKSCEYAKHNAWIKANKEKKAETDRLWRASNQDKCRVLRNAWALANPEKSRVMAHNKRVRRGMAVGKLSYGLLSRLMKLQHGKCACCKKLLGSDYHMDHIMPLALGGTNTDDNMQLLCVQCNLQKSAKHPADFMRQRGFLI